MCEFRPFKKKLIDENLTQKTKKSVKNVVVNLQKIIVENKLDEKEEDKVESVNAKLSDENEKVLEELEPLQLTSDDAPPENEMVEDSLEEISAQNKVKLDDINFSQKDLPARRLWGILILKLREKKFVTLHTACGEIRDVFREINLVKVFVYEEYLFNILTKQDNFDKILFEIRQIDDKISLEFILKRVGKNKNKNNLQLLKNIFGDDLRVE